MEKIQNWHNIPWLEFYQRTAKIQEEIVMAYKNNDLKKVYQLQTQLVASLAGRAIAIRKVITNADSSLYGVDKRWDSSSKKMDALHELMEITQNPRNYRASPPRQVNKENSKRCIPTLIDRAVQCLYYMAIDPIVEEQSDPHNYGFRVGRSERDAIARIRTLLDKKTSPQLVMKTEVASCFDKRLHDFLLDNTIINHTMVLSEFLKYGKPFITNSGEIYPILCNIALNGLEDTAISTAHRVNKKSIRTKVHLTRYTNTFVCTGDDLNLLKFHVKPACEEFIETRGLQFKKSNIVSIKEGFDFLGFTIQSKPFNYKLNTRLKEKEKISHVLIIKPQRQKVMLLKSTIRQIVTTARPIESIIRDLNPMLRNWSNYFRISYHSIPIMGSLAHYIWQKMWKWARTRHPLQRASWIYDKYIRVGGNRKWIWGKTLKESLFDLSTVTQKSVLPLKQGLNPYIIDNQPFFERKQIEIITAKFRAAIYQKYQHRCPHCNQSLYNGEGVELHHIISAKSGGKYSNILPLHTICHQSVNHTNSH